MTEATLLGERAEEYVKNMATDLGLSPKDYKIKNIIKTAPRLTKAQVNKKIIAASKSQTKKKPTLADSIVTEIKNIGEFKKGNLLKDLENSRESHISSIQGYQKSINNYLSHLADVNRKIKAVLDKRDDFSLDKQVLEVIQNPFYQFLKIEAGVELQFTTSEVVMKFEKPTAGINYRIELGRYLVRVRPKEGFAAVYPYENNIIVDGKYPHPHIKDENGGMCWGNAQEALKKISSEGDIRPIMSAIEAYLQTYNEESPYRDISSFHQAQENKKLLKGKKGKFLFDEKLIVEFGCAHQTFNNLKKTYMEYLKYPIKYTSGNFFFPYFVISGSRYVPLKDGSWIACSDLVINANIFSNDAIAGRTPDQCVDYYLRKNYYYNTGTKDIDLKLFANLRNEDSAYVCERANDYGDNLEIILRGLKARGAY